MATTSIQPYLFFAGRCEEALDFYKQAIGAQVDMVSRFKDSPEPMPPGTLQPGFEDKVMHASFRVGDSLLMASDGCDDSSTGHHGYSLSLSVDDLAEAGRLFNALSAGGQVTMPLTQTFWSPGFGMVTDRFGVQWMVNVYTGQPGA